MALVSKRWYMRHTRQCFVLQQSTWTCQVNNKERVGWLHVVINRTQLVFSPDFRTINSIFGNSSSKSPVPPIKFPNLCPQLAFSNVLLCSLALFGHGFFLPQKNPGEKINLLMILPILVQWLLVNIVLKKLSLNMWVTAFLWEKNGLQCPIKNDPTLQRAFGSSGPGSPFLFRCRKGRTEPQSRKKNGYNASHTVDGWNPAPVDIENIPLFTGFYIS